MVETLISSLRPIGNIVLICCAFFIIFGILGVQVGGPACPWVSRSKDRDLRSVISSCVSAPGRPSLAPRPPGPVVLCWGLVGRGRRVGPLDDRPPRQLFKGKFYYCEGADTRNISTRAECRAAHYRWVRRKYNFDNLGQVGGARAWWEGED